MCVPIVASIVRARYDVQMKIRCVSYVNTVMLNYAGEYGEYCDGCQDTSDPGHFGHKTFRH